MGRKFATLFGLRAEVKRAKNEAEKEARGFGCKVVRSRGMFLCTANARGQCPPNPEAEGVEWDGSLREIESLISRVENKYPEVENIYIAGGFDGADSVTDFKHHNYEPSLSSWEHVIWTRDSGEGDVKTTV